MKVDAVLIQLAIIFLPGLNLGQSRLALYTEVKALRV